MRNFSLSVFFLCTALLSRISKYFYTLRYLRVRQWLGRVRNIFPRILPRNLPRPAKRCFSALWIGPKWKSPSLLGPTEFRFAECTRNIRNPNDWQLADVSELWLYNLHYFDDLNAIDAWYRNSWHLEWIQRWITDNPIGQGKGWDPYPTSLRIVNWVRWGLSGHEMSELMLDSLAVQARWLVKRLETHILGNHLWSNAKALCFAGAYFEGSEANHWLECGLGLLRRELSEQCLSDGAHFERSPMYHGLFLEDILDLLHLAQLQPSLFPCALRFNLEEASGRALAWMIQMTHPDGDIAFFNDTTLGVCPQVEVLRKYRSIVISQANEEPSVAIGITDLTASGFFTMRNRRAVVLADVGGVGPDYLPGHAHAGTLSFELSVDSRRLIVNRGVSVYGSDVRRHEQRSTAAHSSVVVDGENSSEVWAGFRVARRARVTSRGSDTRHETLFYTAEHDGYRRLRGSPLHRRTWSLSELSLCVYDEVEGAGLHEIEIIFHLARCWRVRQGFPNAMRIIYDGSYPETKNEIIFSYDPQFYSFTRQVTWHPGFGIENPIQSIVLFGLVDLPMRHLTRIEWGRFS